MADPLWFKDAIIYEAHVRAFYDSTGGGIGDFRGLTSKLDYLEDLGVTAIWLLPFYPSPLRDDGYDIADYTTIHPQYGRLEDFKEFLQQAHRRGLRVITELVINHTSDQHPWFQRARLAPPGSVERDFYVWSDTAEKYKDARIIFKDFEPSNWSWDHVAKAYYWHRFYSHQPDLNFDNPAVWEAIFPVLDFWMEMGVDGMRLDAIPYLYEREGTNCENLPETHVFLKALRKRMEEKFPGRMFLAEANQWPEDAVAYFGDGDECHMSFHFPLMPRLFMALHQEDRFPVLDILAQTPAIPDNCQWCLFLRNHDELTLEMVTDEERDYMYRAYATDRTARINLGIRRRLAPLLRNERRRIELMNALLFSLPGTPVLYYGDEIGMGDNIYLGDRNGVRTPMQWSGDRNAGFSRANPQGLYLPIITDPEYHYEAINVENQQNNPSSLLWWMKRLIALRKRYRAFGRGTIEFLHPANTRVLAFVRKHEAETVLVVANLSRFVQHVELDLHEYRGTSPVEMFGRSAFPPVGEGKYPLSLGPHAFFWFELPGSTVASQVPEEKLLPVMAEPSLDEAFVGTGRDRLEELLPAYLSGKLNRLVNAAHVEVASRLDRPDGVAWLTVLQLEFREGMPERMLLPLRQVAPAQARALLEPTASAALARLGGPEGDLVVDALTDPDYCRAVLRAVAGAGVLRLGEGELIASPLAALAPLAGPALEGAIELHRGENNTSTVRFGQHVVMRTFRRVEEGANPDLELGEALARVGYTGLAPILGHVEFRTRRRNTEPFTVAVLHAYTPHQSSGWQLALDHIASFFERVAASPGAAPETLLEGAGEYRLMGQCAGAMHAALAQLRGPGLAPEPMGRLYRRSLYQSLRNVVGQLVVRLRGEADRFPEEARPLAAELAQLQAEMFDRIQSLVRAAPEAPRIRCHGDYHLAQLMYTGAGFVVTDFEGDPYRPLGERRTKRTALYDVASLVNSLAYVVGSVLYGLAGGRGRALGVIRGEDLAVLQPAAAVWFRHAAGEVLAGYLEAVPAGLVPADVEQRRALLDVLLLEKMLSSVDAELDRRPEWAVLPLRAALRLLGLPPALGLW